MKRAFVAVADDSDSGTPEARPEGIKKMDKSSKRSKPASIFNREKILCKVKLKIQLSARLKEAATAFLKVAVEVIESPYSTAILQEMESIYRDLTLQGYFGLKGLQALQMAIISVPKSFCNVRDDYIHNIVTLFCSGNPVTPEIVRRIIPFVEENCDFQKLYSNTVKQYSTQVWPIYL